MQQLGDLGNCSVHSFNSVPAFPMLELNNLPAHTQIMYEVNWHLVDSLDGELNELSVVSNTDSTIKKIAFTKSFNKPPSIRYVDDNVTTKWNGSQIYSYRPWGQGKISQDGYLTINTGWVNHSISKLQIQHFIGANEEQTNEAMYLSHVKVWLKTNNPLVANSKGVGAIAKIAGVNRFGSITNIKINNSGVNYKANTLVYVDLPTLPLYGYYTTNNFIQSINFNTRHYFDIKDSDVNHFDIVTGFEVLEHFNHPLENIKTVFDYADTAIFSTELIPFSSPEEIKNWWYLTEETGQHIAFYTTKAMEYIAQLYNRNYYCRNGNIHVFTTKKLSEEQVDYAIKNIQKKRYFFGLIKKKVKFKINRVSLLESDYQNIKKKLNLL
jgi:hypothetical protein